MVNTWEHVQIASTVYCTEHYPDEGWPIGENGGLDWISSHTKREHINLAPAYIHDKILKLAMKNIRIEAAEYDNYR